MNIIALPDLAATQALAAQIAAQVKAPCVIYLSGDLGAGKTTWTRFFLQALGYEGAVKSPTYTLVEPYEFADKRVYHFDLYRLNDPEELEFIGLDDYLADDAICVIEWPVKGEGVLPPATICINLSMREQQRYAEVLVA